MSEGTVGVSVEWLLNRILELEKRLEAEQKNRNEEILSLVADVDQLYNIVTRIDERRNAGSGFRSEVRRSCGVCNCGCKA